MFKKMEYVYAVYKERSFTKAANKLYISQPCLSAAIKKIEDEIGMPLFERRYSDLRPTRIGMDYIEAAEKIMEIDRSFSAKVKGLNELEYGKLDLGGSNFICSYIFPMVVEEFSRRYPKIEIGIGESNSNFLRKYLENEGYDLIFDSINREPEGFECEKLFDEKIYLAVPAALPCNEGLEKYRVTPRDIYKSGVETKTPEEISVKHFENERFILLKEGLNMYDHAMAAFAAGAIEPNVAFKLSQLMTSYSMAKKMECLCFVSDTMFKFQNFDDDVYLYNVKGSGTRSFCIMRKRNHFTTAAMEKFVEITKEIICNHKA